MTTFKLFSFYIGRNLTYIGTFTEKTIEEVEEKMIQNFADIFTEEYDRITSDMDDAVYYGKGSIMAFHQKFYVFERCLPFVQMVKNRFSNNPGFFLEALEGEWRGDFAWSESRTFYVLVKDDTIPLRVFEIIGNVEEGQENIL